MPALCKNIAGGWTQNAISIIFAKYRLVSEVLGIWFLRRAISNFVHNFLLILVKDWYSCQLLIVSSDNIVCWSKFPNFDMWVGCQKLGAMLNLCLIEYKKTLAFAPKNICFLLLPICLSSFRNHFFCLKNSAYGQKIVVKLATGKVHWITVVIEMVVKVIKHPQSHKLSLQWCLWYGINVFIQMVKIFFNWQMRLVDWFHWHFCIVVRVRVD